MTETLRYTCQQCGYTRRLGIQYLDSEQIEELFRHEVTATCGHCLETTIHTTQL